MRKGSFILEMIIVMAILLLVAAIMLKPMRNITRDIPQQQRDYRANSVITGMIDDLRKDIETSNGLTRYKGNVAAGTDMLLIDSPDGVISYTFEKGKVTRLMDIQKETLYPDGYVKLYKKGDKVDTDKIAMGSIYPKSVDRQDNTKPSDTRRTWDIPGGAFDWRLRTLDGKSVAVEISTGINRRTHSGVKTNLKNSHVIFLNADSMGGQL